mgnify:FL=1
MKAVLQVFSFDVVSKIILGALGILLIRYMPSNEYADYTFALSLVAFVTQSVASTFNRIYILFTPQPEMRRAEWTSIGLQLFLVTGLAVAGLPLLASLGGLYWAIAILVAASCISEFAKTYYQRDLKFLKFSLIELYRSLLFLGCALALVYYCESGVTALAVVAVQSVSLLAVSWWALGNRLHEWKATSFGEIAKFAGRVVKGDYACLFAYFFVLGVFTQTDVFMLKILGSDNMIATYGSAFRYYSILSLALGSVHAVLLPMIQKSSSHQELRHLFAKHKQIVMAFIVVVAFAGWLAGWVIPWIDAGKYPEAVATFRILCVSAVISFAFSPHVNLVMRFERYKFLLCLIVAAFALNVSINLALIPSYGAVGAAIATMISAATVTISIYVESRKLIKNSITI